MAIIKFRKKDDDNNEKKEEEKLEQIVEDESLKIKQAVEEHILTNFAVKNVLGMDIVYKINKNDIGVIGVVVYEHKRREGVFTADFIAKGSKIKDKFVIDNLAFSQGEPYLYNQILNILKAKNCLPQIN